MMTTKEQIEAIAIESSRDFDAWVAEHVFGWKEMKVPADASGKNACVILAPPQGVHKDYTFPPKGKLHRGFLAPKFSSDVRAAMDFANEVGIRHIPLTAAHNPLAICRIAMRVFRAPETPKEQMIEKAQSHHDHRIIKVGDIIKVDVVVVSIKDGAMKVNFPVGPTLHNKLEFFVEQWELSSAPAKVDDSQRIETGTLQFDDDWPGLFIRGDNALMNFGPALERVLSGQENVLNKAMCRSLLKLLKSVDTKEPDQIIKRQGKQE